MPALGWPGSRHYPGFNSKTLTHIGAGSIGSGE